MVYQDDMINATNLEIPKSMLEKYNPLCVYRFNQSCLDGS